MPTGLPTLAPTKDYSLFMIIPSSFSAALSVSVVITLLMFRRKTLLRKPYLQIILYIFISNSLTSIGSSVGFPRDGSALCWFQGITTNVFTLSSCLWTLLIPFVLMRILNAKMRTTAVTVSLYFHVLCWGIPIFVTLLPLLNMTYGSPPGWCWIVDTNDTPAWAPRLWYWVSYYIWIWISITGSIFANGVVFFKLQQVEAVTRSTFQPIFYDLAIYNLIIALCWMVPAACDFISYNDLNVDLSDEMLMRAYYFAPTLMGFLGGLHFWMRDKETRNKLRNISATVWNTCHCGDNIAHILFSSSAQSSAAARYNLPNPRVMHPL